MLPHWTVNPGISDTSDFQVLHATPQLIPVCDGSLSSLDPYAVMLHWSEKKFKFKNQYSMTT